MKQWLQNESGAALAFVMMALIVVFLMVSAAASLAQGNIRHAGAQSEGLQAHYIARSGAELAYEAIKTDKTAPTTLMDELKNGVTKKSTVDFLEGTAEITAKADGTRNSEKQTIVIESLGTIKDGSVTRKVTLEFYVQYDKYPRILWSN